MKVCAYCGEAKGESLGCCGENHWEEIDEDEPCGCRIGECESKVGVRCRMADELEKADAIRGLA